MQMTAVVGNAKTVCIFIQSQPKSCNITRQLQHLQWPNPLACCHLPQSQRILPTKVLHFILYNFDKSCMNMQTVLEATVVAEQSWQTHPEQSPQLWQLLQQWRLSLECPGLLGVHGSATTQATLDSIATTSSHTLPCRCRNQLSTASPEVSGKKGFNQDNACKC